MKGLPSVFACAVVIITATGANGQTSPYVTNIRAEGRQLRGTLVNPLPSPLTAWTIEAIDGRRRVHVTSQDDALLAPSEFVPAKGSREITILVDDAAAHQMVFRAGVTTQGVEIGDLRAALAILEARTNRATAVETMLDYLRSVDVATPGEELYPRLKSLLGTENEPVLDDVRRKVASNSIGAWMSAAEEIRNANQAGAVRFGVLRQLLAGERH